MKKEVIYNLGLDIGTDSVGAAAVDERYRPLKYKGEPIMVSHLFDAASSCEERRGFRTARRRLDRRQQRVTLIDEIFAPEVLKEDPDFYLRKKESALYLEDKSDQSIKSVFFTGDQYTDKEYYEEYPTIHHLLCELIMNKEKKFDLRLINIAIDWLVAHRGHFLSEVGADNVDDIRDFGRIYDEFVSCIERMEKEMPWDRVEPEKLGEILKERGVNHKKRALMEYLYNGKIANEEYFLDKKELVTLLAGGKVKSSKLFREDGPDEEVSFSISDDMEMLLPQLGDYAELIGKIAMMYDWSVLSDILQGSQYLSAAKVAVYEQHKKDLKQLKAFVKKYEAGGVYEKGTYYELFRKADPKLKNYTAYSYNVKSVSKAEKDKIPEKKASKEEFFVFLSKLLRTETIKCDPEDEAFLDDMKERIALGTFLPKQVDGDNRVIPYQLYWIELIRILENASAHYPFLRECDKDGYSNQEKIKSVFRFRIPYFVGPLVSERKSAYAWMKRKAEGKIFPWNFDKMVDFDESEQAFINRMTNRCTYLPGESVLPKWSLLYSKYTVLNEINNITMNGIPISFEIKQGIFKDLFCAHARVSRKKIQNYLIAEGVMQENDTLGGIDETIKSCLKARYEFRHLLENKILTEADVEKIIERSTYTEEKSRFREWIKREYTRIDEEDLKYISRLKYSDFGRLSKAFLTEMEGASKETGEIGTIMHFLWTTNDNLMQLLSDRYTFRENIENVQREYYSAHPQTISTQLEELGVSNAVKRPIIRTIEVVKDIVSGVGCPPKKIFIEMARGAEEKKRTKSRYEQLMELYRSVDEDTRLLEKQLEDMGDTANNRLQSDALFLYYLQLGKCMYSGRPIDLTQLKSTKYNIDHIYPQSYVKDDSLLHNRVLVESELNGDKKDVYPIDAGIRNKMSSFWKMLCDKGLITKEKYARLIRNTPFSESEKMGFINRQLVETRQSTKAVSQILGMLYPDTEIVYVKANLASDFRKVFHMPKSRLVNDLHHAKDAYLNVVVGNVYHERFTKKWFSISDKYSMKTEALFTHDLKHGDTMIWDANADLMTVRKVYAKNSIHLTRYAYCAKGGLFDQMPIKKAAGLVPIKQGRDTEKYGGYNKASASFFVIARYKRGGKKEVSFVPVELMSAEQFMKDEEFAKRYIKHTLEKINTKKIEDVELPLGKRVVKIKSLLSLDGYKVWVNGKANGGKIILLSNAESLILSEKDIDYIKKIEKYIEKKKNNKKILHDSDYDGLSENRNGELYLTILSKLKNRFYSQMPGGQSKTMEEGLGLFKGLSFDDQVSVLMNCLQLLKSGRSGGCDLSLIGGKAKSGAMTLGSNLSSGKMAEIRILDVSPAGIHTVESINLKELLK